MDKRLEELIREIFVDNYDRCIMLINEHKIDVILLRTLSWVENFDSSSNDVLNEAIGSFASSFLTGINSRVEIIDDPDDKAEVEYIVSEISKQILISLVERVNMSPKKFLIKITFGLRASCDINGWDYDKLSQMMSFDLLHSFMAKGVPVEDTKQTIDRYYEWTGERTEDLDDLAYFLKDSKAIRSTKEFHNLFHPGNTDLIRFDRNQKDFIIVLFDELCAKKLISPRGDHSKKFTPLRQLSVDFEEKVLFTSEIKHRRYRIGKNELYHREIKGNVHKWINGFKKSQLP
ncbi:MAG: hypothetical protein QNK23_16415 [Crocinitomicaceae bacterium]|nr:hypothetical protein [Crocinitomicaceae bacterium]